MSTETSNILSRAVKYTMNFRKNKAAEKGNLLADGVPAEQIEDLFEDKENPSTATHFKRKALEIAAQLPTAQSLIESSKGLSLLDALVERTGNDLLRKMLEQGTTPPGEMAIDVDMLIDHITPSRAPAAVRVTSTQLTAVSKLLTQWMLDEGKKPKGIKLVVAYLLKRFEPALMASLKPEILPLISANLEGFMGSMSDDELEKYGHVVLMLMDNLTEAMNYKPEELSADDL